MILGFLRANGRKLTTHTVNSFTELLYIVVGFQVLGYLGITGKMGVADIVGSDDTWQLTLHLLLHWVIVASMVAKIWNLFILKVKNVIQITKFYTYQLHVLSRFLLNIYRVIKIPLDLIINISMLGIQAKQEKITSQLLNALHHLSLTNQAS